VFDCHNPHGRKDEQALRIGLNLLHAVPEIGGGWNYIGNLLSAVAAEDIRNAYVAFVTAASAALVPRAPNFRLVSIPIDARVRAQRVFFENTILQALARRERLDCMHWFANAQGLVNAARAVVTVYDLQPFVPWGQLSTPKRTLLRWQLKNAAKRAAMLLPMSSSTAAGLQQILGVDPRRMMVIPPTLEQVFSPPDVNAVDRCRRRYSLPERFWLYVAHMYVHKNHVRLLEAYRELRNESPDAWPLILRGDAQPGGPELQAHVRRLGLEEHVLFLSRLPREELPALYGAASALVFASLYEGAGIPVLEAQACGCPVVASDIAPVREFAGTAAMYFDPFSVTTMRRAMIAMATYSIEREHLRRRGLARAREFRITPVVPNLLAAYRLACSAARTSAA
jgi:glycosyltransferase involved in cell wall biosynthesis